ncbi:MAG: hypothetical protein UE499_04235 [Acutalibacteraceae bacterium]|nr:hypothetical protein [Acutalibacteraceae bacterium]
MGYYSELAIEDTCREDYSYPSPEMQLRWRIEDLESRLEDIVGGSYGITAHYYMGCRFSKEDLAYAPPEYFSRASDIITAISIAEEKLIAMEAAEADIQLKETTVPEIEEIPGQLTIWDILPVDFVEKPESELKAAA